MEEIRADGRQWFVDNQPVEWLALDGIELDPSNERDDHEVQVALYVGADADNVSEHRRIEVGPEVGSK